MFSDITPEDGPRTALTAASATRLPVEPGEASALLGTLLEQTRDVVLLADAPLPDLAAFRVAYVNPAFVQSGLGKAVRGLSLSQALTVFSEALSRPALLAHVRASLSAGLPVRGEPLTGEQAGQPRHALLDITPVPAPSDPHSLDGPCRWLVCLRDADDQRLLEAALRGTQGRYQLLADTMADVVSLHDTDGTFLYVTPSILKLTGYSVEETLGRSFFDFAHPDDLACLLNGVAREDPAQDSPRVEWRRLCRDGTYLWMETTVTRVPDDAEQPYRMVCASRDISTRRQAEDDRREEQTLLQTLIESLPDQMYVKDRQGRYLLDNDAHRRWRRLGAGEIFGKTVWDLFPPELAALYEADEREVLEGGHPILNRQEPTLDGDAKRRWLSTTRTPLLAEDGSVVGLVGISRDVTDLHEAAEELRQNADKYRLLFQANPQPMWVYDVKTLAFLAVNDTALARYGYSRDGFLGMTLADIRPPEDMPALMQNLSYAPEDRQVSGPWRHLCADGSIILVEVHSHPITLDGREARLVISNNITERRRVETEAEQLLAQTKHLLAEAVERADRDPLTGLFNHRAFHKRLEVEAAASRRSGRPLSIAMMDMDNFKFFNDGYGHSVGDEVLKRVARALHAACRPGDSLARFGGDEFALLMPGAGAEEAVRLADGLVSSLTGVGYRPPGYDTIIPLSLSIGIAVFPDDGPGRLDALAAADARLIRVKTGGEARGELTGRLRAQLSCSAADFSMLNALVTAVDAKDRYTRRHSEDVMTYSVGIAQELGLDEDVQQQTLLAALLHDVGKIGVPDHVLRKPGRLAEEEYEAIKQHPTMGSVIVGAVPGFEAALGAIRYHHERWDGGGYPSGLRGEEIPLMARLMAVADAFSAMTTDRPYRKGMDAARAVCLLQEGSGTQWDPACVQAFQTARRKIDTGYEG